MSDARIPVQGKVNAVLAQRRSALRAQLIARGALSYAEIAARRGVAESTARTFVARERDKNRLFTVEHHAEALVPDILLGPDGEPTAVAEAVEVLRPLGLDGWELWAFLVSPSGWLSGDVPAEVFVTDPGRARAAVQAYAAELAATLEADCLELANSTSAGGAADRSDCTGTPEG